MKGLPDFKGHSQNFESGEDPRARAFTAGAEPRAPRQEVGGSGELAAWRFPPPTHLRGRVPGSPRVCTVGPQGSARRRLPLTRAAPQVLASQPEFHTESAQMILIKGHSRKGLHLGKNCNGVYVLLKSRTRGSRWGLFILRGGVLKSREAPGSLPSLRLWAHRFPIETQFPHLLRQGMGLGLDL